jgi:hypothetical protein
MKCKKCSADMAESQHLSSVTNDRLGKLNPDRSQQTVSVILKAVCSCEECGYSISFQGMITGFIQELVHVESNQLIMHKHKTIEVT